MDPYKHEHTGTMELSWAQLGDILTAMAETIGEEWRPDIVIGIAKGGVVPGIFLSSAFLVDFFPIKLSSRHNEQVVGEEPEWYVRPTEHVKGKKVLLVDDICIAGRTFGRAVPELNEIGVAEVRTAAIAVHSGSVRPDFVGIVTDECIVWPWDHKILLKDGRWAVNPEYMEEIKKSRPQSS